MNPKSVNAASRTILGFGAFSTIAALIYMAQAWSGILSGFTAWALAPNGTLLVASYLAPTCRRALVTLIISALVTALGLVVYADAALFSVSSTSALVFIFAPLYQLVPAAILVVVLFLIRLCDAKRNK